MTDALVCWYWLTGWFWMLQLSTQLEHNIDSPAIAATGLERRPSGRLCASRARR